MPNDSLQIGIVASALSADPREAVRMSRQMGFVGLQFDGAGSSIDVTELSGSGRREFRNVLSSQNQQLVGLLADVGPSGLGVGSDIDRAIARLEKVMEAAAGLGSPLVCIDIGSLPAVAKTAETKPKVSPELAGLILLPEPGSAKPQVVEPAPPPDPAFVSQVSAAMDELGRRADRYSVMLAFRSELASFASLRQAVHGINCPWFGIDLDPVAGLHDAWDMDEIFSQFGPLIRHVRGRDALQGADRRTKAAVIGQGNVNWPALLGNLDEAGYRGWMTIDPVDLTDRIGAARGGLKQIQKFR